MLVREYFASNNSQMASKHLKTKKKKKKKKNRQDPRD